MKQLKKTLLTLVALLAVTTGAWAGEEPQLLTTINASSSFLTGSQTFDDIATVTFGGAGTIAFNNGWIQDEYEKEATVTVKAVDGYTITSIKLYAADSHTATISTSPFTAYLNNWGTTYVTTGSDGAGDYVGDELARIEVYGYQSAPSGTPVDIVWDAAAKTATIAAMPAGNVTVNVKYFAQAELAMSTGETPATLAPTAIADVPANTDAPIVTAGTVANIGESEVKQGTLKYFVKQADGNTAPSAPDYDTDGWSEDVPTANGRAEGNVYVWYYIEGAEPASIADRTDDNTRSDSDIKPLGTSGFVTLLPEPTYDVSLNQTGMAAGEPALWSAKSTNVTTAVNLGEADLEGVKKGETVTVTYTGTKKVIGVKAEKKAAVTYPLLSAATAEDIGKVVCAAGHLHDAKTAVPDGCTAVGIVGKVTETGHGLILALKDATQQIWPDINGWTSETNYAGTTLKVLPAGALGSLTSYTTLGGTAVSNWAVAQYEDYKAIFTNLGSTTAGNIAGKTYDGNVNAYITTGVGGTAMSANYWCATPDGDKAWYFRNDYWTLSTLRRNRSVRPVLGF